MYIPGSSPFAQPAPVLPVVLTLFMSINMTCDCMHVCYQCVGPKRQDFVKLDESRGDLSVGTSGVEIWIWGPVGWRFGYGDQRV